MGSPPTLVAGTLAFLGAVHSHGGFAPLQCNASFIFLALIDISLHYKEQTNFILYNVYDVLLKFIDCLVYVRHLVRSIPSFNFCHFCPLSECALALQERPLWHWESHKGGETSHKTRQQSLLQPLSHLQPPTSSLNLYFFSENVENFLLFLKQLIIRHRKAHGCILRCSMSD